MNGKLKTPLAALLTAVCLLSGAAGSLPAMAADGEVSWAEEAAEGIIGYELGVSGSGSVQEWIDGELCEGAGSGAEWYIMALSQSGGGYDFSKYAAALRDFLTETPPSNAVERQRCLLALAACGESPSDISPGPGGQGTMSLIFGIHLLANGFPYGSETVESAAGRLLGLRLADGGWAIAGEVSDTDVTAMAVQALAPLYDGGSGELREAVDGALELLSGRQLSSGGFKSFGAENPESCAQVITALSSLGRDCLGDPAFIKDGSTLFDALRSFADPSGGFRHTAGGPVSRAASQQVFYALTAYIRASEGKGPLYIFDAPSKSGPGDPGRAAPEKKTGYKVWVYVSIAAAAAAACAALTAAKKRNRKNYLAVLAAAALLAAFTALTDFSSAEKYYTDSGAPVSGAAGRVTVTIRCDPAVLECGSAGLPEDGVILSAAEFDISEGETAFGVLIRAAKKYRIHVENSGSVSGGFLPVYIVGINHIYEFQHGDLSGWVYRVNGVAPSVGCGDYRLSDGDSVEWLYTCGDGSAAD